MYDWENQFNKTCLKRAKEIEVVNVKKDLKMITANIKGKKFKVKGYIKYNSPYLFFCSCSKKDPCEHEAAVRYYIEEHPELFKRIDESEEILNKIDEDNLKKFVLNEIKTNETFKEKFINKFEDGTFVDEDYYFNKLDSIAGNGYDYGFYDFSKIGAQLCDFIENDIEDLLNRSYYELACRLLIKLSDILSKEYVEDDFEHYNVVESYNDCLLPLLESMHLSKDLKEELSDKSSYVEH